MRFPIARACFSLLLSLSGGTLCADTVEERASTVISQQNINVFQRNAAAVATKEAVVDAFQFTRNEESSYVLNPGINQVGASHKAAVKDLAIGGQYPLGGAAIGYHYNKNTRSIRARNEQRGAREAEEEFLTREHKLRFAVDLTEIVRAGFTFRYQSLEADLLGSQNLSNQDHTRYHGNRSGYGLGFYGQLRGIGIGLYTNPPLRGKAVIYSEQKIITDPGQDGLDFDLDVSDRLKIKVGVSRWTYKKDDRDDEATSPIDQRAILLRGLDLDQYYRKTSAIALGGEFLLTGMVALKASATLQQGVFLFDRTLLPGKGEDLETSSQYKEFRGGVALRNKEFMAELMLSRSSRELDSMRVNRGEVGINSIGSYENKSTSVLLSIGAAR